MKIFEAAVEMPQVHQHQNGRNFKMKASLLKNSSPIHINLKLMKLVEGFRDDHRRKTTNHFWIAELKIATFCGYSGKMYTPNIINSTKSIGCSPRGIFLDDNCDLSLLLVFPHTMQYKKNIIIEIQMLKEAWFQWDM